jgi:Zn-dependent protease
MRAKELRDLTVSALVLALAFGIALSGGYRAFSTPRLLLLIFLMSIIAVSLGFILHEIGHRFVARRLGCFAEYTMWPAGLMLAVVVSFFSFVFAAPGAVVIYPRGQATLTKRNAGLISIVGPVMNLSLALVFILLNMAYLNITYLTLLFSLGARINTWLAVFNLIPFGPLDGAKIFRWHKGVWAAVIVVGIGLLEESLEGN